MDIEILDSKIITEVDTSKKYYIDKEYINGYRIGEDNVLRPLTRIMFDINGKVLPGSGINRIATIENVLKLIRGNELFEIEFLEGPKLQLETDIGRLYMANNCKIVSDPIIINTGFFKKVLKEVPDFDLFFNNSLFLAYAVLEGDCELAKFLLDEGLAIYSNNHYCIKTASKKCDIYMLQLLLDYDANPNIENDICVDLVLESKRRLFYKGVGLSILYTKLTTYGDLMFFKKIKISLTMLYSFIVNRIIQGLLKVIKYVFI